MQLQIINQSRRPVPQRFLQAWVRAMSRLAARKINPKRYREKELVLVFVGAREQRKLNKTYRGKDYATDVLSFESLEPGSLGELVICPEVISRQAKEHGLLVREELGYMVLHGFLHLLGYDHETSERDAKKMFKLQDELFEELLKT
jgi:probable rRNA maturation factor